MDFLILGAISSVFYLIAACVINSFNVVRRFGHDFVLFALADFLVAMTYSLIWESLYLEGRLQAITMVCGIGFILFVSPLILVFINFNCYRRYQ